MQAFAARAFLALLVPPAAFAAEERELLKTCATDLHLASTPEDKVPTNLAFFRSGARYLATYEQLFDEETRHDEGVATVNDYAVRPGLTGATPLGELNDAERGIVLAMIYALIPGADRLNLELEKIAEARVYTLGLRTGVDSVSVLEARDASGAALGTFFGGSVATNCK